MARTVRICTTFTPLEAAHIQRQARAARRPVQGWLHLIVVERLREEALAAQSKETKTA